MWGDFHSVKLYVKFEWNWLISSGEGDEHEKSLQQEQWCQQW